MTPTVAVIIPVHNRREYLERAVESVLKQTFKRFECIVVDDGSDDGSDRPARFTDNRVRLIRFDMHSGVSRARNAGVAATRAPLIAFLDSDDEWKRDKLKSQLEWLTRHPHYEILQSREEWIRNGVRVNPPATHVKREGNLFAASLERCMVTPSSVLLTRTLFAAYGGFNESLPACEDYDLWLRITARHRVGLVDEIHLCRYGGHGDQLSATVPALDRFRVRSMLGLLIEGGLTRDQRILVTRQLCRKTAILANGYKKRGNQELYERYNILAQRYRTIPAAPALPAAENDATVTVAARSV